MKKTLIHLLHAMLFYVACKVTNALRAIHALTLDIHRGKSK